MLGTGVLFTHAKGTECCNCFFFIRFGYAFDSSLGQRWHSQSQWWSELTQKKPVHSNLEEIIIIIFIIFICRVFLFTIGTTLMTSPFAQQFPGNIFFINFCCKYNCMSYYWSSLDYFGGLLFASVTIEAGVLGSIPMLQKYYYWVFALRISQL